MGAEWDAFATTHAKRGLFTWVAVAIIYQWAMGRPQGRAGSGGVLAGGRRCRVACS